MTYVHVLGGIVGAVLLVYLTIVLLKAESF
jgi:K+-transporting ATPase KdpF subunit